MALSQGVLQKNCILKSKEATVAELLQQISETTGFSFSYDSKLFKADRQVKLSPGNYSAEELLRLIFSRRGIDSFVQGDHIILRPMLFSIEPIRIRGSLRDSSSLAPLPGATINFPDLKRGMVTDSLGRFSFRMLPGSGRIMLSLIGYKPNSQRYLLTSDTTLSLFLASKAIEMNEVVVYDQQLLNPVHELAI